MLIYVTEPAFNKNILKFIKPELSQVFNDGLKFFQEDLHLAT